MATSFPTSLDVLTNPNAAGGDRLDTPAVLHDGQHANANDAIEALQAKVGIDGNSAVTSTTPVFVGNAAPSSPPAKYMWIQTLLGSSLTDLSIWVEDGT